MTRTAKIDFAISDAVAIVDAIMNSVTTAKNLTGFRNRVGGAAKADKLYPHTREALNLLKEIKQKKRHADAILSTLAPYNARLAAGESFDDIIRPIISAWRIYYAQTQSLGLMDSQILILKIIESAAQLKGLTGKPVPGIITVDIPV
ncbi:TPA: hypothetical protein ACHW2M_002802 [Yersinia enterocolitica]|uniref:hypothetical protein n=1 Tax=Yersinia enterocolitica TaxID=630 RepID=UPI001F5714C3|nr:hypothetical protein [Yersinia enterocolitica]EKN3827536.1 hypothetical protein [Yersinia enterocolitica]EKN4825692.1 hypothetical protein [Yersinia enterocolitica]EKN5141965.1 hypothetical protein [Yersinia enterocolitica]ELW8139139.1 hypothetical protein [Yersinia enterocolitica]ELW8952839.1 hypothetical protein [Yersinia enterocolitica]